MAINIGKDDRGDVIKCRQTDNLKWQLKPITRQCECFYKFKF